MSVSLLQQTPQRGTYLKKGGEGLPALQKHQNKTSKSKTQPSENGTIHYQRKNRTS